MKNYLKMIFASSLIIILSACAFVPESVSLQPQVNVGSSHIGNNKTVALDVIDARPNKVIGGRASGLGPQADISLADDLVSTVRTAVSQGLSQSGFKVVSNDAQASRKLVVRIVELQYQEHIGLVSGSITITSTLSGTATNKGKIYEEVYRIEDKHTPVITPTSEADAKNINAALSGSLNKLLNDQKLLQFLAQG